MKALQNFFEEIIERFDKYDNVDTAKVITDVVNGLTFRG